MSGVYCVINEMMHDNRIAVKMFVTSISEIQSQRVKFSKLS